MTAPAPLDAAIEEARRAVEKYDYCYPPAYWDEGRTPKCYADHATDALRSLLLALDADDRLAKAEAALREIRDSPTAMGKDIARRYFAEKGDDRG